MSSLTLTTFLLFGNSFRKSFVLYVLLFVPPEPLPHGEAPSTSSPARRFCFVVIFEVFFGLLFRAEEAAEGLTDFLRRPLAVREGAREEVSEMGNEGEAE